MENRKENKMGIMPVPKLVISMSLPIMVSMLIQSLYNIVDSIFVARISEDALTATSIAYSAQMLQIAVAVGTGVGVNALVSRYLGAKNRKRIQQTCKCSIMIGVGIAFIATVVFGMIDIGIPALRIISLTFALSSVTMMIGYFLAGLGNGMVNMISTAMRQVVVLLPVVYVLGLAGGLSILWYAFWVSELCAFAYAVVQMKRGLKRISE